MAKPVVVELFESQGCSSCPPANDNLARIADRPDVIALNFAVTYWDSPAWKDTFGQAAFTARQWAYARAFGRAQVFTPEVVVDGREDGVGADRNEFRTLVTRRSDLPAGPSLALVADEAVIGAGRVPPKGADVWLVRYDPRIIQVPIHGGENGGRTLPHKNVVKELRRLGDWSGAAETLHAPRAAQSGLVTVILVQGRGGGPILAAVKG
jgi:hypothetical protein